MSVKKIESLNKHENPATNTNPFNIGVYLNDNWDTVMEAVNNNADELETKQGKEEGKGLSTNDFTDVLKEKLEGLDNYDDTQIQQDIQDIQDKNASQDEEIANIKEKDASQDKDIEVLQQRLKEKDEQITELEDKVVDLNNNQIPRTS